MSTTGPSKTNFKDMTKEATVLNPKINEMKSSIGRLAKTNKINFDKFNKTTSPSLPFKFGAAKSSMSSNLAKAENSGIKQSKSAIDFNKVTSKSGSAENVTSIDLSSKNVTESPEKVKKTKKQELTVSENNKILKNFEELKTSEGNRSPLLTIDGPNDYSYDDSYGSESESSHGEYETIRDY
jgi:Cu/Ag efflux protein CusF